MEDKQFEEIQEDFVKELRKISGNKITTDSIVKSVMFDLNKRSNVGLLKYGKSLDRTDLNLKEWLQHAYEETLDNANYLKRAIKEL